MKAQAQFGRRNAPPQAAAPRLAPVELTAQQRTLLFTPAEVSQHAAAPTIAAPWSRGAGLVACAAVSVLVVALSLARQGGEPQAGALAFRLFSIASNISLSCWLTQKICSWRGLGGSAAYGFAGAAVSVALSWLNAQIGLGESELGLAADALAGGGAALLYWRLAGRSAVT